MPKKDSPTDQDIKQSISKSKLHDKPPLKWQERLLPTMERTLIGLTIFFFLATFLQMTYLHLSILRAPEINIDPSPGLELNASAKTFDERLKARQFEVRSRMEEFIVTQRYHQANVLLMSGLWVRYLGFITGMVLALVGASFVLGKLREPAQKLSGKFSIIDISLRTTSPGVIMVLLGVVLMFATILDKDYYQVTDGNIYLSSATMLNAETPITDNLLSPDEIFGTPTPVSTMLPP